MKATAMFLALAVIPVTWVTQQPPTGARPLTVTKVASGDTVVISGIGKVRLLGVQSADGPALRFGHGSSSPAPQPNTGGWRPAPPLVTGSYNFKQEQPSRAFLQKLILVRTVRVEYDPFVSTEGEQRAYLFLDDGLFVNAEMLRTGHARVDLTREFVHEADFKRLEEQARHAGIGIWLSLKR
jgi:endonuclease YncB( thermonuclease family)